MMDNDNAKDILEHLIFEIDKNGYVGVTEHIDSVYTEKVGDVVDYKHKLHFYLTQSKSILSSFSPFDKSLNNINKHLSGAKLTGVNVDTANMYQPLIEMFEQIYQDIKNQF